jgi:hypothetical protein
LTGGPPRRRHLIPDSGTFVVVTRTGAQFSAVTVIAIALGSLRSGPLPNWLAWLSLLVAATMLLAVLAFFLSWLGWVLVVSIVLTWRHEAPSEGTDSVAGPQTTTGDAIAG